VVLAWGCTQPRFAFLRLHVIAMLGVIGVRLLEWDGLLYPQWNLGTGAYLPFAQLRSWPPFAAAVTFALVGRLAGRIPQVRFPTGAVMALGLFVAVAAVDGEAHRMARLTLAPLASPAIHDLIESGILVAVMGALWWVAFVRFAASNAGVWTAGFTLAVLLGWWSFEALIWPGGYGSMLRCLGAGFGLWWLHVGTVMLVPFLLLLVWLGREIPNDAFGLRRDRLQALLYLAALGVAMLLLRREVFAITHAPPLMDFFPDEARRAAYRTILSLAYALLAFGVYFDAVRRGLRERLRVAYALYAFTAFKVYFFDLESQNQLYRAFSLLVFAAITFVSSWFANRQERMQNA